MLEDESNYSPARCGAVVVWRVARGVNCVARVNNR